MARGEPVWIEAPSEVRVTGEAAGQVAGIHLEFRRPAGPGATRRGVAEGAERVLAERGVRRSFRGYDPAGLPAYPVALSDSVNRGIVRGVPGLREFADGDMVSLDLGVEFDGGHGNSVIALPVGRVGEESQRPLDTSTPTGADEPQRSVREIER